MERSAKRVRFIDMSNQIVGNYLKIHRRRCGLSQRELGSLVGYESEGQVRRHEHSKTTPPLLIALAYEVVFQVPVSEIFVGFQSTVARVVETNLYEFRRDLQRRSAGRRLGGAALLKSQWLTERPTR
jgi:DNA-binding XRE family transcriptional regulator